MSESRRLWAIVPAGGIGRRMGRNLPKQYLPLAGKPMLTHTCGVLLAHASVTRLVLVVAPDDVHWRETVSELGEDRILLVAGGEERAHSVRNGLALIRDQAAADDWVLVHDAARPCLRHRDLDALLEAVENDSVGGLLGVPVRDTMKRTDGEARVTETVDRTGLWHALTPQIFRFGLLCEALDSALEAGVAVTDEASAVERLGYRPLMVEGSASNIKVTHPEDLALAEWYLTQRGDSP
ncbi:MAG: 2-C-methyl-D-erythritol 4-phosphate cytidylyltransferase [Gammaproteobacteria bacterium]